MSRFGAAGSLPRRSIPTSRALAVVVTTVTAAALAACVDPKSDYDDFLARTSEANAPTGDDGPASDGASPDAGFTQDYVMACVSQIADDDPKQATYFVVTVTFVAAPGGGGTLDFTDQALALTVVGSTVSPSTSISSAVGPVVTVKGSPVSPDGHCDVVFGPTLVPGAADAVIVGSEIDFTDSTLHFLVGPGSHSARG
jgi:hypothetical protein